MQINNLTITLRKDLRILIEDFSFVLNPGDCAVIIGEEGDGKSTLIKLICNETLVESYCDFTGTVSKRGERLGYLPQELPTRDQRLTAEQFCAFSETGVSPKDVAQTSRSLGLPPELPYSDRIVATLSGGERVKLALLRLLLDEPDILLLDEPTNDVDLKTLEFLERFIIGCGKPVLYVSHDETLIERTANVIIHLEQLRRKTAPRATVSRMPYAQYIAQRERAFESQTRLARAEKAENDARMERYRQIYQKVEHQQNKISRQDPSGGRLLKKKMHSVKSIGRRFEREAEDMTQLPDYEEHMLMSFGGEHIPNGKTVLELELPELAVAGRVLARDFSLRVTGAERVCITGRNGAGKTTLLRHIAGLLSGRTDICCGYMPQNYADSLPLDISPVDFLTPSGQKSDVTRAMTALGNAKFTADEMRRPASELSGGQKAKLMFLGMILSGCDVLILDEPTRNFSPLSNPVIRRMLCEFGGAVIAASHDRKFIEEVCTRTVDLTAYSANSEN